MKKRFPVGLLIILFCALLQRVYAAFTAYLSDFDTGTVALMSWHILQGKFPLFFYGQNYMGALEAYVASFFGLFLGLSESVISLSPILFSLGWIAGMYGLYVQLFKSRNAGIIAALCTAFPGWYMFKFSISAYGGYPAACCLGTLAICLCLRMQKLLSHKMYYLCSITLGLVSALGLWTHYSIVPYLLTAGVFLWPQLKKNFMPLLLSACIASLGFLPALILHGEYSTSKTLHFNFNLLHWINSIWNLVTVNIPGLLYLDEPRTILETGSGHLSLLCLFFAVCLIARGPLKRNKTYRKLIFLFTIFFMLFYLPHSMSTLNAPRYIMTWWSLLIPGIWIGISLQPARNILFALWIFLQALNAQQHIFKAQQQKSLAMPHIENILKFSRAAEVRSVAILGGVSFTHMGQVMTMRSRENPIFFSSTDERYQPYAQAFEAEEKYGYLIQTHHLLKWYHTLEILKSHANVYQDSHTGIAYDLQTPLEARSAILPEKIKSNVPVLLDRIQSTTLRGQNNTPFMLEIDLGQVRHLSAYRFYAPDQEQRMLPDAYRIFASTNGINFNRVASVSQRIRSAYTASGRVYFQGYYGCQEHVFNALKARYLKIEITGSSLLDAYWEINEMQIFEKAIRGRSIVNVNKLRQCLQDEKIRFTFADRWLSAHLAKGNALPRYNPRYTFTHISRHLRPNKECAVAALNEHAQECKQQILKTWGMESLREIKRTSNYTLFLFNTLDTNSSLFWNGHFLLEASEK